MPVPSTFGVYASSGSTAASFVSVTGYNVTAGNTSQAVAFSGAQAGDVAFIHLAYAGTGFDTATISGGAGGWTKASQVDAAGFPYYATNFTKALASGDLGGVTVNFPNLEALNTTIVIVMVYRGASTATLKASASSTTTTLSLAGFNKSGSSKGIVSIVSERDVTANFIPPGTFTARGSYTSSTQWRGRGADITNPSNYADGTNVVWSDFLTSFPQIGFLYELT